MSQRPYCSAFERPVRLLVGHDVGVIWTVEQALDWIDHHRSAYLKQRLKLARLALRHAGSSGTPSDIAASQVLLESALAREQLLAGTARPH